MCHGPGVSEVPFELSLGPMPPPKNVVTPLLSAAQACYGAM
jgi:hypothetical protein